MALKVPAYEGNEPYIFISYAHKDIEKVIRVLSVLHERGIRLWYDDGIAPGSEWPEYIATHLDKATAVVSFITDNSVESSNCRREITFALSRNKPFVSVFFEETKLPLGLELQISAQQSVLRYNFDTEEGFLNRLCSTPAFEPCKSRVEPEKPASVSAVEAPKAEVEATEAEKAAVEPVVGASKPEAEAAETEKVAAEPVVEASKPEAEAAEPVVEASKPEDKVAEAAEAELVAGSEKPAAGAKREEGPVNLQSDPALVKGKSAERNEAREQSSDQKKAAERPKKKLNPLFLIAAAIVIIIAVTVATSGVGSGGSTEVDSVVLNLNDSMISFKLEGENVTPAIVKWISKAKKLKYLSFENCTFSEGALDKLNLRGDGDKELEIIDSTGIDDWSFLFNIDSYSELHICNCGLTDAVLPDLSELPVEYLDLSGNAQLTTVSPNLDSLRSLDLSGTGVTDFTFLTEAPNVEKLRSIDLSDTGVTDLSFLAEAPNLTGLYLRNVGVSDLSSLIPLSNLRILDLSGVQMSTFDEEFEFLGLEEIYLNGCGLESTEGMEDYTKLQYVDLGNNSLTDVSSLENIAPNLKLLDISGNKLDGESLDCLNKASQMEVLRLDHLDLSETQLSFVNNMVSLKELSARDCGLTDISWLDHCCELEFIRLSFNDITGLPSFDDNDLKLLDLAQNQISDLSPITDNYISDVVVVGNPISAPDNQSAYWGRIWIDYYEGLDSKCIRGSYLISVSGCPRNKKQSLSDMYSYIQFNTREEQLELIKSEGDYVNYDGYEEMFLAIPVPEE